MFTKPACLLGKSGAAGETRTLGLVLRRHALYPPELQPRAFSYIMFRLGAFRRASGGGLPFSTQPKVGIPRVLRRVAVATSIQLSYNRVAPFYVTFRL